MYTRPDIGKAIRDYMKDNGVRIGAFTHEYCAYMGFQTTPTAQGFVTAVRQGHLLGNAYKTRQDPKTHLDRLARMLAALHMPQDSPIIHDLQGSIPGFSYPPEESPEPDTLDERAKRLPVPKRHVVATVSQRLLEYALPGTSIPESLQMRVAMMPAEDAELIEDIIKKLER